MLSHLKKRQCIVSLRIFKNCKCLFGFRDREDHFLNLRLSSGLLKLIHVLSGGVVQIKQVFSRNFISDCNCIPPLPLFWSSSPPCFDLHLPSFDRGPQTMSFRSSCSSSPSTLRMALMMNDCQFQWPVLRWKNQGWLVRRLFSTVCFQMFPSKVHWERLKNQGWLVRRAGGLPR